MASVTFSDGTVKRVKRMVEADAKKDLAALIQLRDTENAPDVGRGKLATFDEVVEAWIDAGAPNVGVTMAGGGKRRHAKTKKQKSINTAREVLRPSVTRPKIVDPKARRKYPNTERAKADIGNLKVDRTQTERVEQVFYAMEADGLASGTIDRAHFMLNSALVWGMRRRKNKTNPAADCILPELRPGKKLKSFTLDQSRAVFLEIPNDKRPAFWLTAFMTGTRPGEIIGVRWPYVDIDGDEPYIAVDERADELDKKYIGQAPPKVGSNRTIGLHPLAVAALLFHREDLQARNLYDPEGFVFPVKSGRPLLNSNVCQYFKDLCERAGLGRDWTTNELRHSFASVADEMLNDRKLVGKVMGHKKEATTAGYIHSVHAVRPVIANAVEAWTLMLALPAATEAKSA